MQTAKIFQENYQAYCDQIAELDLLSIHDHLGVALDKDSLRIDFFTGSISFQSKISMMHPEKGPVI